jgi:putative ABC transport system permease protein
MYLAFRQNYFRRMTLLARTAGGNPTVGLREAIHGLDQDLPVIDSGSLKDQIVGRALLPIRLGAALVGAFGLLGLVLASAGVYGVMTHAVSRRTREIGIRMALGARGGNVLGLILRRGMILTLAGLALGVGGALAGSRVLAGILVGVSATDPLTFAAIPVFLALVALGANFLPARRASGVDPMAALRSS